MGYRFRENIEILECDCRPQMVLPPSNAYSSCPPPGKGLLNKRSNRTSVPVGTNGDYLDDFASHFLNGKAFKDVHLKFYYGFSTKGSKSLNLRKRASVEFNDL